uniref:Uncharacterized protein n=1 Tax=Strongyloides papillosus TaxID=174720 RepID=A0A0N5BDJ4_STREA
MNDHKYIDYEYSYFDNLTSAEYNDYLKRLFSSMPEFSTVLEQVDIGTIHLILSLSFFIFQLLVFTSFLNKKELFKNTCFHIIF